MHEMRSLSNVKNDDVASSSQFGSCFIVCPFCAPVTPLLRFNALHGARTGHVASRGGKVALAMSQLSYNLPVSLSLSQQHKHSEEQTQLEHACSQCKSAHITKWAKI